LPTTTVATPRIPLSLESARLVLRLPAEDDLRALHAYFGDAESVRYTYRTPLTEGQAWRTLASFVGHWAWRGYGPYTLVARDADAVVGICGLWYSGDWPEMEIMWALVPAARGRGLAAEAVRAVRAMARNHLPGVRPISLITVGNEPSVRVAVAAGATLEREIEFAGARALIYRHAE